MTVSKNIHFHFFLMIKKRKQDCFSFVYLFSWFWLIVQEDSFPPGVWGPGQSTCHVWVYENGGDRMLMRRPGVLPTTAVPWSAPHCQLVMNLWGCARLTCHLGTQSVFTRWNFTSERDGNLHTHTQHGSALPMWLVCREKSLFIYKKLKEQIFQRAQAIFQSDLVLWEILESDIFLKNIHYKWN